MNSLGFNDGFGDVEVFEFGDGMFMYAPLMLTIVISVLSVHPCCFRMSIRGSYLSNFVVMVVSRYRSWQYVNSMVVVGEGVIGGWLLLRFPRTHSKVLPCIGMGWGYMSMGIANLGVGCCRFRC